MSKEIERKFLVVNDSYVGMSSGCHKLRQGYLSANPDATVRVRVKDDCGYLTVKGRNRGMVRDEWEYAIDAAEARQMLELCQTGLIEKTRYIVDYMGFRWEIDRFGGHLRGLTVAEIELADPAAEPPLPPFVGREVTDDPRYYNSSLCAASGVPD